MASIEYVGLVNAAGSASINPSKEDGNLATVATNTTKVQRTPAQTTATASGNTTVYTPTSGKKVRVHWFSVNSDAANLTNTVCIIKFTTSGTTLYKFSLMPGVFFTRDLGASNSYIEGAVNEALVINLSVANTVYVNYAVEEI